MENGRLVLIVSISVALIFSDCYVALGPVGGWKPIANVTDPTVVDIGKFAVDEHNVKEQASLRFAKVVSGERQVVAGMKYRLRITAADGSGEKNYVAVVWDRPWQKLRQLISFTGPV